MKLPTSPEELLAEIGLPDGDLKSLEQTMEAGYRLSQLIVYAAAQDNPRFFTAVPDDQQVVVAIENAKQRWPKFDTLMESLALAESKFREEKREKIRSSKQVLA